MIGYHFLLHASSTGRTIGHALVCPDVGYASVRWRDGAGLERRSADATFWWLVLSELEVKAWPDGRVDVSTSTLSRLLLRDDVRGAIAIRYLRAPTIAAGTLVTVSLDAYLQSQTWPEAMPAPRGLRLVERVVEGA